MNLPQRPRRLRMNPILRNMVRETRVSADQLVQPLFVVHGNHVREPIPSMSGQFHFSTDMAVQEAKEIYEAGIKSILLFGIPQKKDDRASEAYAANGIVQCAIDAIKKACPEMYVITDVCLCEYMSHGHCGIVKPSNQEIDNDATLELLARTAVSHAKAGADMVTPSDMMDGRVAAIRTAFDSEGYLNTPIMSYSAKYASSFYGPFREAACSAPSFGDRKTYQMDPPNVREAIKEIKLDVAEGADIVMVKPALAYLDVIAMARRDVNVPIAAYNVSGEYAMIKAAAQNGWIDERQAALEVLTSIRRAGADIIITYFAKDVGRTIPNY